MVTVLLTKQTLLVPAISFVFSIVLCRPKAQALG